MPEVATVTDCLERARECANQAEALTGDDRTQMLAVANAWLKLADEVANEVTKANGRTEQPSPPILNNQSLILREFDKNILRDE